MIKVNSKIEINKQKVKEIEQATLKSLEMTAEATLTDLTKTKGYMPFDSGTLQNESTSVDRTNINEGKVSIVCGPLPYVRRIYYNADNFNFQTGHNANARDHWFEPYISGEDKDFIGEAFKKFLKKNL